jgi:hypothetical protein
MTPRGFRNNNPGNIDRNATKWQGMADDQSSDPRFVVFKTPQWGIRALARTLLTYQNQYGLKTVKAIINRWAPPGENDTGAYVKAVAESCGVDPSAPITLDSCDMMLPLVKAIIVHENGSNPYSDALISEALHMAGISDAKPKPLVKQTSFIAQAATGVSVAGAACAQYAPTVKTWADKLADYTGSPIIQHAVTILLTVAGVLTLVGLASSILKQRAAS